jgi:hypothetical protein
VVDRIPELYANTAWVWVWLKVFFTHLGGQKKVVQSAKGGEGVKQAFEGNRAGRCGTHSSGQYQQQHRQEAIAVAGQTRRSLLHRGDVRSVPPQLVTSPEMHRADGFDVSGETSRFGRYGTASNRKRAMGDSGTWPPSICSLARDRYYYFPRLRMYALVCNADDQAGGPTRSRLRDGGTCRPVNFN